MISEGPAPVHIASRSEDPLSEIDYRHEGHGSLVSSSLPAAAFRVRVSVSCVSVPSAARHGQMAESIGLHPCGAAILNEMSDLGHCCNT
jgi:hypothetical protein